MSVEPLRGCCKLHPPDILAKELSNGLQQIRRPFILVIDDYHRIREPAIHELLAQLLRFPYRSFQLKLIDAAGHRQVDSKTILTGLRNRGRNPTELELD